MKGRDELGTGDNLVCQVQEISMEQFKAAFPPGPGRELDALVAEKVMQVKRTVRIDGRFEYPPGQPWKTLEKFEDPAPYSTDIAAAWEVLERIKDRGQMAQIHFTDGRWAAAWRQYNDPPSKMIMMTADTAPLAICLAALKSVNG